MQKIGTALLVCVLATIAGCCFCPLPLVSAPVALRDADPPKIIAEVEPAPASATLPAR